MGRLKSWISCSRFLGAVCGAGGDLPWRRYLKILGVTWYIAKAKGAL